MICFEKQVVFMLSCSGTDVLPQRDESSGKPCAVIESYRILAPTRDLNPGGWIHSQNSEVASTMAVPDLLDIRPDIWYPVGIR